MPNIFRVTSPVHVRAEPTRDSLKLDALSPGDEVEVTWMGADGWWRVTVTKVTLYAEARVGKRGYCYSVGTLEPVKPIPAETLPETAPLFKWWYWLAPLFIIGCALTLLYHSLWS